MKKSYLIIITLLIGQTIYSQGLSINNLLELRPKSISELDVALNNLNYELENAVQRDNIKQLNYRKENNEFKESVTVHQYSGRDNFITYYYDSLEIASKIKKQIKERNAKLIKEDISNGNIIIMYRNQNKVFFLVKNEDISSVTIYTTKDFDKYYNN